MKVLMISADSSVAQLGSEARERMRAYASLADEMHVIVANGGHDAHGCGQEHHEGALHVYPTCSRTRLARAWNARGLAQRIIRERGWAGAPDILITTQDPFELGLVGVILRNKFKLKLQVQCHLDFMSPFFAAERVLNRVRRVLARFVLCRADAIRVVSERIAASLVAARIAPREKIVVLPIWVDVLAAQHASAQNLRAQFPEFKKIILMASRLTHEKQTAWACAVLRAVCKRVGAGIVVLGDGPERAALAAMPHVRTLGWITDIAPYLKGADLFVNASLYEGYGRTLVQAAAAGVPTVTTDVGVAHELFHASAIVAVEDANALVTSVEDVLSGSRAPSRPTIAGETRDTYLHNYKQAWERALSD